MLDQATRKDQEYDAADDPRRLRPIDPDPEGKPAWPDPIHVDEEATRVRNEERAKEAEEENAKMMKMLELQTAAFEQQTTALKDCQILMGLN